MKKYRLFLILILIISCSEKSQELLNINASIQQSNELKENPLLMHPITFSIKPKDSTMSTLYGNEIAFDYAKQHSDFKYPKGAILYEVTWRQKSDELWFGGNIPKEIYSVEKISFDNDNSVYEKFKGKTLKKTKVDDSEEKLRKYFISEQKMTVSK
ncbi:MAG: hypothetical protein P0Y62_19065 [Candidatus Chryseobacterium colombiense]|uniref:hypothetical protein n=1 Tax=Chryseobacterium sp. BIGb0232 TaxID=2940598 RepID=UPI000F46C9C8|nr:MULTISPECIES: hypothetical protein [unclassified Chryseobacterium]MCS4302458.1 hypothetical protein [Chryseobacterium sp. BIGb0232]ROS18400.1 hypothetical protein EDF65_2795 [Chryseobacterium nakagawai]WEK69895.1 MAG: hypothetical protein P0Y62_19065 [Chryseobacterium sp.]